MEAKNINNNYTFDKLTAKKNAKDFVENIMNIEKKSNIKNEFNIEYEKKIPLYNMHTLVLENDEVKVELDNKGEPIVYRNKLKTPLDKIISTNKKLNKEDLQTKATNVADGFGKEKKILIGIEEMFNGYMSYKWARTYDGYNYDLDFVSVTLDTYTGDIILASKMYVSNEPQNKIKLDESAALKIAIKETNKFIDCKIGDLLSNNILIVNPNYKWSENATSDLVKGTRLAYAFTFRLKEPYEGELTLWIDAENGSFLGGTNTK